MANAQTGEGWLDELVQLAAKEPEGDGFLTKREMARRTGKSMGSIGQLLHMANDMGLLESRPKRVKCISGSVTSVASYRVKKPTKRGTKAAR